MIYTRLGPRDYALLEEQAKYNRQQGTTRLRDVMIGAGIVTGMMMLGSRDNFYKAKEPPEQVRMAETPAQIRDLVSCVE